MNFLGIVSQLWGLEKIQKKKPADCSSSVKFKILGQNHTHTLPHSHEDISVG